MSDRLIDKIGALLAKAESTDSEHERDALVSKAQSLATANAINLEVARQRQGDKTKRERPVQKSIKLFNYTDKSKTKSFFVTLWYTIADQNDVKVNIYHDSSGVIAFGFPSDIDVIEALYASLSVQMVAAAEKYLKTGEYKKEIVTVERRVKNGWWTDYETVRKPMSGQTARRNFYQGFTAEIGRRLRKAREDAEAQVVAEVPEASVYVPLTTADDNPVAVEVRTGDLVLREKREEVADFYKSESRARGSYRGGRTSSYSSSAQGAGRDAGRSANLGGSRAGIGSGSRALR